MPAVGEHSSIEWTHHTFNPWWGCSKVSPACEHCYAEAWAKRVGKSLWGLRAERRFFSDAHWREPLRWNARAAAAGVRRRVFCASMADVFEARDELRDARERLWILIADTPALDWLLLTKRPEHVAACVPWGNDWPQNVWLGTTVETQRWAQERIPHLLSNAARVRFLSCEPLLGPLDLAEWLGRGRVDWVIAGGESGPKARPMDPIWPTSVRDQCKHAGVAFHFKQWGDWGPSLDHPYRLTRVGKKAAGRHLDGRTWDQFPASGPA
jgi:protein gp37